MPEFRVERTSLRGSLDKPCDEAVLQETQEMTDDGSCKSREVWVIRMDLLDEMITFRDKYGELILDYDPSFSQILSLPSVSGSFPSSSLIYIQLSARPSGSHIEQEMSPVSLNAD